MSVASQMLLNQVTIFAPKSNSSYRSSYQSSPSPSSSPKSIEDLRKENARAELADLFGDKPTDRYAFGWADPREIMKDE